MKLRHHFRCQHVPLPPRSSLEGKPHTARVVLPGRRLLHPTRTGGGCSATNLKDLVARQKKLDYSCKHSGSFVNLFACVDSDRTFQGSQLPSGDSMAA